MPLPVVSTPPTEGGFILILDDASTYSIPAALLPVILTPGRPVDNVGRAVGSTTWIRHGPGGLTPEPLRFTGSIWGSDASSQLDALQAAARAAVTLTFDGPATATWVYISTGLWVEIAAGESVVIDGGDVNARERNRNVFNTTLVLFPTAPVGLE